MSINDAFLQDRTRNDRAVRVAASQTPDPDLIDGVSLTLLSEGSDERGFLNELLTQRDGAVAPIVHVYQVTTAPGSVRAWTLHRVQTDRLAFTHGELRVVLYDARPGSPTEGRLNVLDVGDAKRCLLHIPPLVIHAVQNRGSGMASFVNMPTAVYDPGNPDKWRVPADHPAIPYRFA